MHCVRAVQTALCALPGVSDVSADLKTGKVTLQYDPALCKPAQVVAAIEEEGYAILPHAE
jgi:copper chaperone CopZ